MIKVVLDTNVLVSATFWRGKPYLVLRGAAEGKFKAFSSFAIINEFKHVLQRDFFLSEPQSDHIIQTTMGIVEVVNPSSAVEVINEDPSDDKILDCALEANAEYIVSADNHLLKLREYAGIRIVTAEEFFQLI